MFAILYWSLTSIQDQSQFKRTSEPFNPTSDHTSKYHIRLFNDGEGDPGAEHQCLWLCEITYKLASDYSTSGWKGGRGAGEEGEGEEEAG